jgi:hypothetical protein
LICNTSNWIQWEDMMNALRFGIFFINTLFHFSAPSMADEVKLRETQRRFFLAGMRAEREKLRSGQVVITGEHWSNTTVSLGMMRFSVRFDVYFDHDTKSYRYTQRDYLPQGTRGMDPQRKTSLLARSELPRGTTSEGEEWVATDEGGTVVHTPEYDLRHNNGHPHVSRLAPGTAVGHPVREWDFATLGLVDWPAFDRGLRLSDVLDAYETQLTCHSVEMVPSGLTCLKLRTDWNPVADSVEYEIWIDEKQGMTPVSISRKDLNDSLKEVSLSDVGWKEINGVMVPVSFGIRMMNKRKYPEGYDLTLEWSHVNEPLDPKVFTPAGITESAGALVADMRLGQVVVERINPLPVPLAGPKPVDPHARSHWGWIFLTNLFVASGGFAWWYYRRKARRRSS